MSAIEAGGRGLAEHPEGLGALGRGEGADDEPRGLMRERLRECRMAVAEARHGDAGEKINVHVAVDIGERRALAMVEREAGEQRDTLAAGRDMALLVGEQRARVRSRHGGGDFRLEAGPARRVRFADRSIGSLRTVGGCRSIAGLRTRCTCGFRRAACSRHWRLRFAHATAREGPPGKIALRRSGAADARASGSAAQSRARQPRALG